MHYIPSSARLYTTVIVAAPILASCHSSYSSPSDSAANIDSTSIRVEFETDEGTWLNVDISPDGSTLLFDLLGTLYTLPFKGGEATPLLSGSDWNRAPRYSPDGQKIAYLSDRSPGANILENLWVLDLETQESRQVVTNSQIREFGAGIGEISGVPAWSADGARIYFGIGNSRHRILSVAIDGGVLKPLEPSRSLNGPYDRSSGANSFSAVSVALSPDGRSAFFPATEFDPRAFAVVSAFPRKTRLYRIDLSTHRRTLLTDTTAGWHEYGPQLSPSGRWLTFIRRRSFEETELWIRDLETGEERPLVSIPRLDDPYRYNDTPEIPAYAVTPDEQYVVIAIDGKIHRIGIVDGSDVVIPMKVHVVRDVARQVRSRHRLEDGPVEVRGIRWPTLSPDGRELIFSAVGYLWRLKIGCGPNPSIPCGEPRRITDSEDFEYTPTLARNGTLAYIAFATEPDGYSVGPGRIMILRPGARSAEQLLPSEQGSYYRPQFSPNGQRLAVIRQRGTGAGATAEVGWIDLDERRFHAVAPVYPPSGSDIGRHNATQQYVGFSPDGSALIHPGPEAPRSGGRYLSLTSLDGTTSRKLAVVPDTGIGSDENLDRRRGYPVVAIVPSPDLKRFAVLRVDQEGYLIDAVSDGPTILSSKDPSAIRISRGGMDFPLWINDSTLVYGWTNRVFRYRVGTKRGELISNVRLQVPHHEGTGTTAFRGARLITMSGDRGAGEVIPRGTLVIRDRRIVDVGPEDRVEIPSDAVTIDASGLTIMPGLMDSHYHFGTSHSGPASPEAYRGQMTDPSTLAYGVTTVWEAHGDRGDIMLSRSELRESGRTHGARWLYANMAMFYWRDGNLPDSTAITEEIEKKVSLGARQALKSYCCPSRREAQLRVATARRLGVGVVSHTDGLAAILRRIADGMSVDHPSSAAPFYRDVREYFRQTGAVWTPQLWFAEGTTNAPHFATRNLIDAVYELGDTAVEKMERFAVGRTIPMGFGADTIQPMPYGKTHQAFLGRAMADLIAAGGKIGAGTDDSNGFSIHFEIWSFAYSGIPLGEVLRTATMTNAEKLGIDRDVGSLEAGKIADFIVLNANPLEKIENTMTLRYTVADGVIYDSNTLKVLSPERLGAKRMK